RDGVHHARDQAPDAALPIGGAQLSTEILGGDDVGGRLAPRGGGLDTVLLEDRLAPLVVDDRRAELPDQLVVGGSAGPREGPGELEAFASVGGRGTGFVPLGRTGSRFFHGRRGHRQTPLSCAESKSFVLLIVAAAKTGTDRWCLCCARGAVSGRPPFRPRRSGSEKLRTPKPNR